MTVAEIDRLVHHAVIFELNVESYRGPATLARPLDNPSLALLHLGEQLPDQLHLGA